MKIVSTIVTAALIGLLIGIVPASAQSMRTLVTIPFDFNIGNDVKTAGDYEIKYLTNGVVKLFDKHSGQTFLFMTNPAATRSGLTKPVLYFNRYGNQYFLSEMHWPGFDIGRAVIQSKVEVELANKISGKRTVLVTEK